MPPEPLPTWVDCSCRDLVLEAMMNVGPAYSDVARRRGTARNHVHCSKTCYTLQAYM